MRTYQHLRGKCTAPICERKIRWQNCLYRVVGPLVFYVFILIWKCHCAVLCSKVVKIVEATIVFNVQLFIYFKKFSIYKYVSLSIHLNVHIQRSSTLITFEKSLTWHQARNPPFLINGIVLLLCSLLYASPLIEFDQGSYIFYFYRSTEFRALFDKASCAKGETLNFTFLCFEVWLAGSPLCC